MNPSGHGAGEGGETCLFGLGAEYRGPVLIPGHRPDLCLAGLGDRPRVLEGDHN